MRRGMSMVAGAGSAALLAWSCTGVLPHSDCLDYATCEGLAGEGGLGREEGGDGSVVVPMSCELSAGVKDSPACIDDAVGVFVSPTGKDGAAGTKADPLRSIAEGVARAAADGKPRVYVCEGSYDAPVMLAQALSIHGGLSCSWAANGAKPKLAPPKGIALTIAKIAGAVVIEDLDIGGAADPSAPGDSAIGVFVSESKNVTFRRTNITAGAGTAGAKGAARSNYTGAAASTGGNANGGTAGAGAMCVCVDGKTSTGGTGAAGSGAGMSDGAANPAVGTANSGAIGTTTCAPGSIGADGLANAAGAASTSAGKLSATGWVAPSKPADAPNGNPAQGGGGGGAKTSVNSAGGGGGCGGCGGAGGAPGTNGGSSFPLLSFISNVVVEGGALVSGPGGAGGEGGEGQPGQAGGLTGTGAACDGGPGGQGAGGSGGGGGAGGHSAPVAFVGTEPRASSATLTPGASGAAGPGGNAGAGPGTAGAAGTPGPEGKARSALTL